MFTFSGDIRRPSDGYAQNPKCLTSTRGKKEQKKHRYPSLLRLVWIITAVQFLLCACRGQRAQSLRLYRIAVDETVSNCSFVSWEAERGRSAAAAAAARFFALCYVMKCRPAPPYRRTRTRLRSAHRRRAMCDVFILVTVSQCWCLYFYKSLPA